MAKIILHSDSSNSATSVSNIFIDEYMSDANGEFVKVYLYLLRLMNASDMSFSISSLADKFEHTEKDIKRALSYWERMHLLSLEYDEQQNLTSVCLLSSLPKKTTEGNGINDLDSLDEMPLTVSAPVVDGEENSSFSESPSIEPQETSKAAKKTYSADDIHKFYENDAVVELLFITERYLGRTLNSTDTQTILYIFDVLGFSTELIEYLIEYCVTKNHTSIRYIEKVALAWAENKIKTVDEAKQSASLRSQAYFTVIKALGITGRSLVPSETAFIEKWKNELGFTNELISEACQRTIQTIHQPSFEYTDSILSNWHKNQIRSLDDITRLDTIYQNQKKNKTTAHSSVPKNKFNNFTQRTYDYDQLEQMLLTTSNN